MTTIFWSGTDTRDCAMLARQIFSHHCQRHGLTPPAWIEDNFQNGAQFDVDVLWINEVELQLMQGLKQPIPWRDINVILAETYWQIQHYRELLDPSKRYITVCDSWAEAADIQAAFPDLDFVANFTWFNDPNFFLDRLTFNDAWFRPVSKSTQSRPYRTFGLIGRKDAYRDRLILSLRKKYLKNSLIKYAGQVVISDMPDLDTWSFADPTFHRPTGEDHRYGCYQPQMALYENFQFETAIETTAWIKGGWPIPEYTITEKTLRPMLLGMPCLMLAPAGYHRWLNETWGIDLGLGCFTHTSDGVSSDHLRLGQFVDQAADLVRDGIPDPSADQIKANIRALVDFNQFTFAELNRFAELMCHLDTA
jgi:hypothetical protein